jgi:hypothetical protein
MPVEPTMFWCGPDAPPPRHPYGKVIHLNSLSPGKNVRVQSERIAARLAQNPTPEVLDVIEVASYVYCADQARTRGGKAWPNNGQGWNRTQVFNIAVRNPERWNSAEIKSKLVQGLSFLSDDNYDFVFRPLTKEASIPGYFDFDNGQPWFEADSIMLFSGGLDSLAGAVEETLKLGNNTVLVGHCPASQIFSRQEQLVTALRKLPGQRAKLLHVPVCVNKAQSLTADTNQRTRSFLYAGLAAAVAAMVQKRVVKFYENGVVSCNLPTSEQLVGARASRSTHPRALKFFSDLFSNLLGFELAFENPYLWKTKTEIVQLLFDCQAGALVRETRSCTHTRTTKLVGSHCGVCSQCVERWIATRAAGVAEHDPDELYAKHLFTGALSNGPERALVESYAASALEWGEQSPEAFFERYPEGIRIVEALGSPNKTALLLHGLHQRQAHHVATVIEAEISEHAELIRRRQVDPSSLLSIVLKRATRASAAKEKRHRFPTPEGSSWGDIEITITSNISARIRIGSMVKRYTCFDMGFRDHRRPDMFNLQWELLCDLAEQSGAISWKTPKAKPGLQKRVQALSKTLQLFFELESNAFYPYRGERGYEAKFHISDSRPASR